MAQLADILVTLTLDTQEFSRQLQRVGQDLNNFRNQMNQVTNNMNREFTENITEMTDSLQDLSRSTRTTGQSITQSTESINQSMNRVSNSSRYLSRTVGTSLRDMRTVLVASTREFRNFGDAGRHVSQDIRDEFSALPRHLQRYVQRLREAGQSTEGFARLNEMYGARAIDAHRRSNDYFQQRTTQSQRLMQSFANDTNLSPLTNGFLRLGDSMERTARQGSVLNIALQRVGNDTSLKNLQDQMRFVQQGIMRARGAFLVFGISAGLATLGMIKLASAVDERVAPAFENLKKTWLDAMMPFITTFATGMVAVMNFVTAIGKMVGAFSEAHPVIFSMLMSIVMLTLVLGALLSPLAVTGIMAEGVAASFGALWAIIAPFVTGVLAVIGVALALATALVVVFVAVQNLWTHSEAFRNAFIAIWESVKSAVINNFVTPVIQSWETLKQALSNLVATVTGNTGTMGSLWTWLGDHLAVVVNAIASVILPIVSTAFELLGVIVSKVIDGLVAVVDWMAKMWAKHGSDIEATVKKLWGYIEQAFGEIKSFIQKIMPQVVDILKSSFELIKTIVDFTMKYIVPAVVTGFQWIWDKIGWIMPIVVAIIKDTWETIKSAITNALNLIQNVISLFTNVLKGNWSGAWENVKAILSSALGLIWDLVQLWIMGKVLGVFKKLGGTLKDAMGDLADKIAKPFKDGYDKVLGWVNKIKDAISSVKNAVDGAFEAVGDFVTGGKGAGSGGSGGRSSGRSGGSGGRINANATGNVFTGASLLGGNQLVGEAGAEVVMPIERRRYMKPYASMVASMLGGSVATGKGEGIVQNITINSPTPLSPSDIARKNLQTARRLALEWEV